MILFTRQFKIERQTTKQYRWHVMVNNFIRNRLTMKSRELNCDLFGGINFVAGFKDGSESKLSDVAARRGCDTARMAHAACAGILSSTAALQYHVWAASAAASSKHPWRRRDVERPQPMKTMPARRWAWLASEQLPKTIAAPRKWNSPGWRVVNRTKSVTDNR